MDDETKKKPEEMNIREYIEKTLQPGKGIDEKRAKQYKMICVCAALICITVSIRLKNAGGDKEAIDTPLRVHEIEIMDRLRKNFDLLNEQPPYIDPDDSRSIKFLLIQMYDVTPFIMEEILRTKDELPLTGDIDLYAVLSLGFRDNKRDKIARPFIEAVERAKKRAAKEGYIRLPEEGLQLFGNEEQKENLRNLRKKPDKKKQEGTPLHIEYQNTPAKIKVVTDKPEHLLYSLIQPTPADLDGQRKMIQVGYEAKGNEPITLFYDLQYDLPELNKYGIPREFSSYDFFVALAWDNLLDAGNTEVTATKMLKEMGFTRNNPAQEQIDKLYKSLVRGVSTTIHIDDKEVQEKYLHSDTYHERYLRLLPGDIAGTLSTFNGKAADFTIKIENHTPFFSLASQLKRVTTIPKELLSLYTGRRTERYFEIMHYLIKEINYLMTGKRENKFVYSTIYSYNRDITRDDKRRTREMVNRLLKEVFVKSGFIKGFSEDQRKNAEPGFFITLAEQIQTENNPTEVVTHPTEVVTHPTEVVTPPYRSGDTGSFGEH